MRILFMDSFGVPASIFLIAFREFNIPSKFQAILPQKPWQNQQKLFKTIKFLE